MSSSDALWLKIWGTSAAIGFIIVIIGVIIEGVEHFKNFPNKEHPRKLQIEKIGWFLVVVGLAMEFLGDHAAKRISDREDARVNKEAADARVTAGKAEIEAGQANERASTNELQVTELTQSNLLLRADLANLELMISKSDRSTWRVYSITAEVRLRFGGKYESANILNFPAKLTLLRPGSRLNRIVLSCETAVNTAETNRFFGPTYLLQFSYPYRPSKFSIILPLFGQESAKVAATEMGADSIQISNFPIETASVLSGSVSVAINEIILKNFKINPGQIENGSGTLTVETNGVIKFLQPE